METQSLHEGGYFARPVGVPAPAGHFLFIQLNVVVDASAYAGVFFISQNCAGEGDRLSNDAHLGHIFSPEDDRLKKWICGLQHNAVRKEVDALERGFLFDQNGGDLAVIHGVLLTDIFKKEPMFENYLG